jgi:hypothetical protein
MTIRSKPEMASPGGTMVTRASFFAALLLCALAAQAQTHVLLINQTLVDNEFIFGITSQSKTQRVLDSTHKALLGISPAQSEILFPNDGTVTARAVYVPSMALHWRVTNITLNGQYVVGQGSQSNVTEIAHGVENDGPSTRIQGNVIMGFRGNCVQAEHWTIVRDNDISAGFTGIKIIHPDCMVTDNSVYGQRDTGIWVATDAGNCHSAGNHYFGCNNGDGEGNKHVETTNSAGAACRIDTAGAFRGTGDIYADSYYGVRCGGSICQFSNCYFQHNTHRDVLFTGAGNELHGCTINAMPRTEEYPNTISVEFVGERSGMFGGTLEMTGDELHLSDPAPSVGFKISGDNCRVQTRLIDNDGFNGTIGIHIAAALEGSDLDIRTWGFHQSNDRIVKVDTGVVPKGVRWVFRGEGIDMVGTTETDGIKKYIDIDADWTGSIEFVNTTTGARIPLDEGEAY